MKYYEIKIEVSELGIEPMLAALICNGIYTTDVNPPADASFMTGQHGETEIKILASSYTRQMMKMLIILLRL